MDARRFRKRLLRQLALVAQVANAGGEITGNFLFRLETLIMGVCRLLVYRIWVTIRNRGMVSERAPWHSGQREPYEGLWNIQSARESAGRTFRMGFLGR